MSSWGSMIWGVSLWELDDASGREDNPLNLGESWLVTDQGDLLINSSNQLARDPTLTSRCLNRLRTRKGSWFADTEFGSTIHLIEIDKGAPRLLRDAITQALEPLVDSGEILSLDLVVESFIPERGFIAGQVSIVAPVVAGATNLTFRGA